MERENLLFLMEIFIREIGLKEICMATEKELLMMGILMKEII